MAILEITVEQLDERAHTRTYPAMEGVLLYTPFCGTCQLAERMLEIVQNAGVTMPLRKLNINYAPALIEAWRVTSVPCLVLIKNGAPIHMVYSMNSVDYLYTLIRSHTSATELD